MFPSAFLVHSWYFLVHSWRTFGASWCIIIPGGCITGALFIYILGAVVASGSIRKAPGSSRKHKKKS